MYASQSIFVSGVRSLSSPRPTWNLENDSYSEDKLEERKETSNEPVVSSIVQDRVGDRDGIAEHIRDGKVNILRGLLDDDLLGGLYRRSLLWGGFGLRLGRFLWRHVGLGEMSDEWEDCSAQRDHDLQWAAGR